MRQLEYEDAKLLYLSNPKFICIATLSIVISPINRYDN